MLRRRASTLARWTLSVLTIAAAAALAIGFLRPTTLNAGGIVAHAQPWRLEVGWGDGTLSRTANSWDIRTDQGFASILLAPTSAWLPSVQHASVGMTPGPLFTINVLYVPLVPWAALLAIITGWLWWRHARRKLPGHCESCGYDLRGLGGSRCPECGRTVTASR